MPEVSVYILGECLYDIHFGPVLVPKCQFASMTNEKVLFFMHFLLHAWAYQYNNRFRKIATSNYDSVSNYVRYAIMYEV